MMNQPPKRIPSPLALACYSIAILSFVLAVANAAHSAPPTWLLQDDGTPLPGIRTSLNGKLAFVEADGNPPHAPLNNSALKKVYEGLVTSMQAEYVNPKSSPPIYSAHPTNKSFVGLVLPHCSTGRGACHMAEATLKGNGQLPLIRAAWRSTTCVVMNAVPCIPEVRKNGPVIIAESLTTDGISGSAETWSLYAGVCYSGFRANVSDTLQASGELADTIKVIVVDTLCSQLGKQPNSDGTLPTFTLSAYATEPIPGETVDQANQRVKDSQRLPYVDVAKKVAKRANAITLEAPTPIPGTDFDAFFGKLGGKVDRARAEEFWLMFQAVK